jgi:arginine exporter protein ArgO
MRRVRQCLASKRWSLLALVGAGLTSLIGAQNAATLASALGRRGLLVVVLVVPLLALAWFGASLLLEALESRQRPAPIRVSQIAFSLLFLAGVALLLVVVGVKLI